MPASRITQLSLIISEKTRILEDHFSRHDLPTPSFGVDGPTDFAIAPRSALAEDHEALLEATKELHDLLQGPSALLLNSRAAEMMSLQGIYHYKIAQALPVEGDASFEDIAERTGLNVIDCRRFLRQAMQTHIFQELRPGIVSHTAASKLLSEDPMLNDLVGIHVEELFPASAHVIKSIDQYGHAETPAQTGFALANNTSTGLYDEFRVKSARGLRFANAMASFASVVPLDPIFDGFDWGSLPPQSRIVDVGGGYGPVSIGLAQRFPHLSFIVQDFDDVVADGPAWVPSDVSSRFKFMAHNFLQEQPVRGADVYFFRAIFHNWPDVDGIRILRNLVPALKPGAWIVIVDPVLRDPGELPKSVERKMRSMDLNMLAYFGARQKTLDEWKVMAREADNRFELVKASPAGSSYLFSFRWSSQ